MPVSLIKNPFEISFTGNPMPFLFNISASENLDNSTLIVRVLIENSYGSNIFDEIYLQKLYPHENGDVQLDVGTILHPYLDYYMPSPKLSKPVAATGQRKRYKVSYILQTGSNFSATQESPVLFAAKGGLSYESWHYKEFFTNIIAQQKKPLLFSAAREILQMDETKFVYWMCPQDLVNNQEVIYKIYFDDETSLIVPHAITITGQKWGIYCLPAGFNQAKLDLQVDPEKTPVKYSIKVQEKTTLAVIVEEYFFKIDHRNFYDPFDIVYRNSIGGLESLRLLGRMEIAAEYRREEAARTVPPSYYSPNLLAQTTDMAVEEQGFSGSTQFLTREQCMKLRDLFLNKGAWQVAQDRLIPIILQNNKTKFYSNKDSLLSVQVEFKNAFTNTFFTPGTLMPHARTCPAVERFSVAQLNRNTLQINYSLEIPYHFIEVEITAGGTIYLHNYSGNTGSVKQPFVNPVTAGPENITIRARTVCSKETTPQDFGPYSTITLQVIGNSLPVAVTDTINVPGGLISPYTHPVSLLANDYDPDGDEIEILSGTFQMPGSGVIYTIDAQGIVTFQTKFYSITNAYFDYQIREAGGSNWVTGRANITVGSNTTIYVRAAQRNVVETTGGGDVIRDGEVWLEYYSDPAGTVPVDVSSYNLTIPARDIKYKKLGNNAPEIVSTTTQNIAASGTKNKIYTGNLYSFSMGANMKVYHEFTVLPGTGYTPI